MVSLELVAIFWSAHFAQFLWAHLLVSLALCFLSQSLSRLLHASKSANTPWNTCFFRKAETAHPNERLLIIEINYAIRTAQHILFIVIFAKIWLFMIETLLHKAGFPRSLHWSPIHGDWRSAISQQVGSVCTQNNTEQLTRGYSQLLASTFSSWNDWCSKKQRKKRQNTATHPPSKILDGHDAKYKLTLTQEMRLG